MTIKEISEKYGITSRLASRIPNREKKKVLVKTFFIYDDASPENAKMEKYLKKYPNFEKKFFQQSGPCSNWGYEIFRDETDAEFNNRILKSIRFYKKSSFKEKNK